MIKDPEKYEIKYWAGGNDFRIVKPAPKRSTKRRLAIVLSFVGVLILFPMLLLNLPEINLGGSEISTTIQSPIANDETELKNTKISEPITIEAGVIKNDNYWKISNRICGDGKFYLDIQEQNNSKALFEGDIVSVKCPTS